MVLRIITVLSLSTLFLVTNPIFADSKVSINEFIAHPSTGNKEWVEFYNPDNVDISNYFLDDDTDFATDSGSSAKKNLSALNKSDPIHSYLEFDSFLNNSGDKVVLFAGDGSIVDQYQFTKDPGVDVSLGRSPDGSDNFAILTQASKGSGNGQTKVDPSPELAPTQTTNTSQSAVTIAGSTSTKTQSPTSTKLTSKSSPLVSSSVKPTPKVLGESTKSASKSSEISTPSPTALPSLNPENQTQQDSKVAYYMAGLGTILIASSLVFYFMMQRKTKIKEEDE